MVVCARCVLHDISKNVFKQAFGGYWKMYGDYSLETNRRLPMLFCDGFGVITIGF
jgi:hypothetical protein